MFCDCYPVLWVGGRGSWRLSRKKMTFYMLITILKIKIEKKGLIQNNMHQL